MSLEKWVEYGWLKREPTSPGEIKDLLGIVERSLGGFVRTRLRPVTEPVPGWSAIGKLSHCCVRKRGREPAGETG
jgi:hypothetical protein